MLLYDYTIHIIIASIIYIYIIHCTRNFPMSFNTFRNITIEVEQFQYLKFVLKT